MKKNIILTISCLIIWTTAHVGCKPKSAETDYISTTEQEVDQQRCYRKVTGRDSLVVKLSVVGNTATGELNWLPFEKDRMTGTFVGTVQDSILTALYTYEAEGVTATEEKIVRLLAHEISLKTGELVLQDSIWKLKDGETAAFTEIIPEVNCRP